MPTLAMLIDYDNLDVSLTRAGAVSLAKLLVPIIPISVLVRYDSILARLYGGWRAQGALTTAAQRLIPDIRAGSPTVIGSGQPSPNSRLRLTVELALGPIGVIAPLDETFVRDRGLRKFRARRSAWPECATPGANCGLGQYASLSHATSCSTGGCSSRLGDIFVRDEQKMVDTLIVADIAQQALVQKAPDVVVVSSDTDMWPGVLLATQVGCNVIHVHTRQGWQTQRHLMNTLGATALRLYQQLSV